MRIVLFALLIAALVTAPAFAADSAALKQHFVAVWLTDGDRTVLQTQLAVIDGFVAYASNDLPESLADIPILFDDKGNVLSNETVRSDEHVYVRISSNGADSNSLGWKEPAWIETVAAQGRQPNVFICGDMRIEVWAPKGVRFEVAVGQLPTIVNGKELEARNKSGEPPLLGRLSTYID